MTPLQRRIMEANKARPELSLPQLAKHVGCSYCSVYDVIHGPRKRRADLMAKDRDGITVAQIPIERTGYVPVSLPAFPWGEK